MIVYNMYILCHKKIITCCHDAHVQLTGYVGVHVSVKSWMLVRLHLDHNVIMVLCYPHLNSLLNNLACKLSRIGFLVLCNLRTYKDMHAYMCTCGLGLKCIICILNNISYKQSQYWYIFQKGYNYINSVFTISKFHHNCCNCTSSSNSIYRYERSRGTWIKSIWADDYSGMKVVSLWVLHVPTNPGKDMWNRWCFVIFN